MRLDHKRNLRKYIMELRRVVEERNNGISAKVRLETMFSQEELTYMGRYVEDMCFLSISLPPGAIEFNNGRSQQSCAVAVALAKNVPEAWYNLCHGVREFLRISGVGDNAPLREAIYSAVKRVETLIVLNIAREGVEEKLIPFDPNDPDDDVSHGEIDEEGNHLYADPDEILTRTLN